MARNRLIVAVDLGTTYTGVSYCETSSTGSQGSRSEVINDWPSRNTKIGTREKVPTEVTYQPEGIVWGSLIAPNVQRHIWMKLQLDSHLSGEAAKIIFEVTASPQKSRKKPVDIIADFLTQIKAHLIKNLDQKFGQVLWRSLPITLVVTVPAVWSDTAKARTLEAFDKAGFNSLEFPQSVITVVATEPECAALHTIDTLRGSTQDTSFKVGDGFIVCDMGGGTVDLISYRVAGLNPTTIEECTIGIGDQCGGTFVDRAFLEWLEKRLGTTDFLTIAGCRSEEVPRISLSRKAARMLQDFTLEVKSGFSGTETNYLRWLVKKGQNLPTSRAHHATDSFIAGFWPDQKRTSDIKLYAAECDKAPRLVSDKGVYTVASLKVDLSIVPKDEFKPLRSPTGALYHQLEYSVEIAVQSSLEYWLSVAGKKYATVTATYE